MSNKPLDPDYQRKWRANNRDKVKTYTENYRARNIDAVRAKNRERMRQRREANPEKYRELMREWNRKNPEKVRAKQQRIHLRAFGLTPEAFATMLAAQDGTCAICRGPESSGCAFSVDHCHTTGRVRGLLCGNCNRALGLLRDNPDTAIRAAEYLRK